MKYPVVVKNLLLVFLLAAFFSACASKPVHVGQVPEESNLQIKGAPDWVNKGNGVVIKLDSRLFHGVASADPMGDLALQKAIADDRARAEVARVLSSYLDAVSSDYMAVPKTGDEIESAKSVPQQIKSTIRANMAGARIIGSWRDPKSNTIWSIAELDIKYVKSTMAAVNDMNANLKIYIDTSADNIFDRFIKEKK